MKLRLRKRVFGGLPALVPFSHEDRIAMNKLREDLPWDVEVKERHRSRPQENFYRKLVRVVADGVGMEPEVLHDELKYRAGKITGSVESPVFGRSVVLKSSAEMGDVEFKEFVDKALDLIFRDYLPGVERKFVLEQVDALMDAAW